MSLLEVYGLPFLVRERSKAMIGGKDTVKTDAIADFFCDDDNDLKDLPKFAQDNKLSMGSTCYCIDTASLYMMKSTGEWKKQ